MKRLYLIVAAVGLVLPYYFFVSFLLAHGFDLRLLVERLFANRISTFFAVDLLITAVVFLVFSRDESQRLGIGHWWIFFLSTLWVGPSFAFPLFLYFRAQRLAQACSDRSGFQSGRVMVAWC